VKRETTLLQKALSHREDAKDAKKFNIKLGVLGVACPRDLSGVAVQI
jgi:hypothetical protein